MALADTVAQTHHDFSEGFVSAGSDEATTSTASRDVDDCGLRYIVSVGHHSYLLKTLSPAAQQQVRRVGIPYSDVIWAFHSESKQQLVDSLPCSSGGLNWDQLKLYGMGWILTDINVLRSTVERLAKEMFQKTKEPLDCAIFYLAMKKKMLIWGLYR